MLVAAQRLEDAGSCVFNFQVRAELLLLLLHSHIGRHFGGLAAAVSSQEVCELVGALCL